MLKPCRKWNERLSAYLDGEGNGVERAAVETHLHTCVNCRAHVELLRCDAQDVTASLRTPQASAGFADRVMAQVAVTRLDSPRPAERARAKPAVSFHFVEWAAVIGLMALFTAVLFPVFAKSHEKARQTGCTSNQRQLALAIQIYTQEHQETLPSSGNWVEEIGVSPKVLQCNAAKDLRIGYAYNTAVSGRTLQSIGDQAASTPLTFDARDGQPDYRHSGGIIMSYVDGHVEYDKRDNHAPSQPAVQRRPVMARSEAYVPASAGYAKHTESNAAVDSARRVAPQPTIMPPSLNYGLVDQLQIAYRANLALENDDVQQTMETLELLFRRYDGFVLTSEFQRERGGMATITGRVPSGKLGAFLVEVGAQGALLSRSVDGEDLTAQQIAQWTKLDDLAGNQGNLEHIGQRAGTVNGALEVERQRNSAASDANTLRVEEYQLKSRVVLADVTIVVRGKAPNAPVKGSYGETAAQSLHALGRFSHALLTVLIVLAIWLPVWGTVLALVLLYLRKRGLLPKRQPAKTDQPNVLSS